MRIARSVLAARGLPIAKLAIAALALALVALVLAAVPAANAATGAPSAHRLLTWTVKSAYVDPAGPTPFNSPPAGSPSRPNALRVDVLLPSGYDGRRRFPVLWLLHGHGDSYDSWLSPTDGDLRSTAAGLAAIVVMPEAAQGWYADWYAGGARRPGWESYLLRELMPITEQRLRIRPGRSNHAIAGLSMGGEGAAYLAERLPGYFGSVATFSGVLSLGRTEWPAGFDTQGQDFTTVYGPAGGAYARGHDPTALAPALAHSRVFVSVGDGVPDPAAPDEVRNSFGQVAEAELRQHAGDFLAAVRAAGVGPTYTPHRGIHAWRYWRADLTAALRWGLFAPVSEAPSQWTYATVDQHAQAWDLTLDFAAPPAVLERFSRSDQVLSASGDGTVTVTTAAGARFTAALPFTRPLPQRPISARHRARFRPSRKHRIGSSRKRPRRSRSR